MFKESALANFFMLLIPVFSVFIGLIYFNPNFYIMLFYVIGFILFFVAKCSQFKKGRWISFGSKEMGKPFKNLYVAGWGFMGFALLITLLTIIS